ncbi:MAG: hypothetical protein EU550_00430 [Promethearchaeota archaeon]|nr:MAG: hypothetical protein EU550_00430 [Candidatus Lokiarchaeota archaeon]
MDGLAIYFSLLGHNKEIAEGIANQKDYEIHEFAPGSKLRVFQFFFGKKKLRKNARDLNSKIEKYSNLAICGPIWGGKPAPAVKILLEELNLENKNVEFHITYTQNYGEVENSIRDLMSEKSANLKEINFTSISEKKE